MGWSTGQAQPNGQNLKEPKDKGPEYPSIGNDQNMQAAKKLEANIEATDIDSEETEHENIRRI